MNFENHCPLVVKPKHHCYASKYFCIYNYHKIMCHNFCCRIFVLVFILYKHFKVVLKQLFHFIIFKYDVTLTGCTKKWAFSIEELNEILSKITLAP